MKLGELCRDRLAMIPSPLLVYIEKKLFAPIGDIGSNSPYKHC